MRSLGAPPAFLLLPLLLLGVATAAESTLKQEQIISKNTRDGIVLTCESGTWKTPSGSHDNATLEIPYMDKKSGLYTCSPSASLKREATIFVKFRTCDNCVELDTPTIAGLVVGNVMVTIAIAAVVKMVASPPAVASVSSSKKRSDKEYLVRNEATPNDPNYQPLNTKAMQTYDKLKPNKR